jgi:hypothetical protein
LLLYFLLHVHSIFRSCFLYFFTGIFLSYWFFFRKFSIISYYASGDLFSWLTFTLLYIQIRRFITFNCMLCTSQNLYIHCN